MKPLGSTEARLTEFVAAQNQVYDQVLQELKAGRKETHWIWFIFPQIAGLGSSAMARKFSIASKSEARSYLRHPVLGLRLRACTQLMHGLPDRNIEGILEHPDNLKFHSSMTLFAVAAPEEPIFQAALDKYFGGEPDGKTLSLLQNDIVDG